MRYALKSGGKKDWLAIGGTGGSLAAAKTASLSDAVHASVLVLPGPYVQVTPPMAVNSFPPTGDDSPKAWMLF